MYLAYRLRWFDGEKKLRRSSFPKSALMPVRVEGLSDQQLQALAQKEPSDHF